MMIYDFQVRGYEDLEVSTQMLVGGALGRGIDVEVLDRGAQFICLKKDGRVEYVKEATKTSKDAYVTALLMGNKLVTKRVLSEQGVRVPEGRMYVSLEDGVGDFVFFDGRKVVVKPNSTNFGIGISVLECGFNLEDFEVALKIAFENDQGVIVEEFVCGDEYRFLVVGDSVVGVAHRVPANVVGDGNHSIVNLVSMKNDEPWRKDGIPTPLKNIELGDVELGVLRDEGWEVSDVPSEGEQVFLRKNSNVSTGGDFFDFTDRVLEDYKKIAVDAAGCVGARICGVDMLIEDIGVKPDKNNHAVIELNFNPALCLHCCPDGKSSGIVVGAVLDLLGF